MLGRRCFSRLSDMPKAGEVRVQMARGEAAALGRWLRHQYAPACNGSSAAACGIALRLEKAAERRRTGTIFQMLFPREHALWFSQLKHALHLRSDEPDRLVAVPDSVRKVAARFAAALNAVGRPALDLRGVETRCTPGRDIEERHQRRLKRRFREQRAWDDWYDRLTARGETILTSSEPPPKI